MKLGKRQIIAVVGLIVIVIVNSLLPTTFTRTGWIVVGLVTIGLFDPIDLFNRIMSTLRQPRVVYRTELSKRQQLTGQSTKLLGNTSKK